jgi:hypothetical protein
MEFMGKVKSLSENGKKATLDVISCKIKGLKTIDLKNEKDYKVGDIVVVDLNVKDSVKIIKR